MKQAFVITVVATVALAAVMFMLPAAPEAAPDLLRARTEAVPEPPRSVKDSIVDLGSASGTELYTPSMGEAVIDGKPVPWPRYHLWLGQFAPDARDATRFCVSDIRIAANREPRTEADLANLVWIPEGMPIAGKGAEMLRLIEAAALGLRAARADLVGGRDLETAERIELMQEVRLRFHDVADPKRRGELHTPALTLHLEKGSVVRASTEQSLRFESPEGRVAGAGFDGDPRTGAFTLLRDIEGVIANVGLLGLKGEPVTVQAAGPLRYEPAAPPEALAPAPAAPAKGFPGDPLKSGGTVVVEGGVTIRQGLSVISGKTLRIRAGDTPVRVLHLVLEGDVEAHAPQGDFFGGVLTYDGTMAGAARLTVSGPGVRARWRNGARIFPGAARDGDLEIATPGTVVLSPVDAADEVPRKLEIGPEVLLTGPQVRAEGKHLVLDLVRVASNKEGADPAKDSTVYPSRIVLDGGFRGESPEARFAGDSFTYSRSFGADGRPAEDRILLERDATLRYVLAAAPASGTEPDPAAADPESKPSAKAEGRALLANPGAFTVAARDLIELVRDPARQRPIEARARGRVVARRLGAGGDEDLLARIAAEEVDLTVLETFVPVQRESGTRYVTKRSLSRALARGAVAFQVPGRIDGEGGSLELDPTIEDADFRGADGRPARATLVDQDGLPQKVAAPRIHFRGASRKLVCEGRTDAELMLAPFMLDAPPGTPPVPTRVGTDGLTLDFVEVEDQGRRRLRVQEARAAGHIEARQDGGGLVLAEKLRFDLGQKHAVLDGAPARIEMVRVIDGHRCLEHIQSPHLTLLGEQALVDGPLEARLHATLGKLALKLDQAPDSGPAVSPEAPKPAPSPLDITASGDLLLTRESIQLHGPATVLQGDPKAGGFRLDGRKATLFLVPADALAAATNPDPTAPPPASPSKALDVARAVVEGEVRYVSADLEAEGDVMEFDRVSRRLLLYGEDGRPSYLTHRGLNLLRHPRPAHVLDFSDPAKPPIYESLDRPLRPAGH